MQLIKLTPKSQRAKNRVKEHGDIFELLVDKGDSVIVRSLEDTFKYREGVVGRWVGTITKDEAEWHYQE